MVAEKLDLLELLDFPMFFASFLSVIVEFVEMLDFHHFGCKIVGFTPVLASIFLLKSALLIRGRSSSY